MATFRASIEFFGVARLRAGRSQLELTLPRDRVLLGEVLEIVAAELPAVADECFDRRVEGAGCQLRPAYTIHAMGASGDRFLRSAEDTVVAGDALLLLAADAGG